MPLKTKIDVRTETRKKLRTTKLRNNYISDKVGTTPKKLRTTKLIYIIGVRGCAPGTAYFIPARAGAWLVWCSSWGRLGDSGLSRRAAARAARQEGSAFYEVRLRRRGPHGCVLLIEIYKMFHRT